MSRGSWWANDTDLGVPKQESNTFARAPDRFGLRTPQAPVIIARRRARDALVELQDAGRGSSADRPSQVGWVPHAKVRKAAWRDGLAGRRGGGGRCAGVDRRVRPPVVR